MSEACKAMELAVIVLAVSAFACGYLSGITIYHLSLVLSEKDNEEE
jgi:hypothetical protein